nr:hypothetical protein [Planctomycetota bacterium]
QITTLVGDAVANAPGILILGGTRLALPLPGTQCFLNTDVIVALPIATTQFGSGEWTLTAPLNLSFVANCQALLFSATLQPTSSNAITITCP